MRWLMGSTGLVLLLGCQPPQGPQVSASTAPSAMPSKPPTPRPTFSPSPTPTSDTSLGPFALVPGVNLMAARAQHTSHVIGSYLYVIGGTGGAASALGSIERAPVTADGRIGTFAILTNTQLTRPRYGHSSVVIGSYLYVIGGWDDMQVAANTVERAVINTNGVIGPFAAVDDVALQTPRYGAVAQVIGDTLYLIGGDGSTQTTAEKAPIHEDGTLGEFTTSPVNSTGAPRLFSMGLSTAQGLFLIGGELETSTERAPLKTDGTLGAFSPMASASLSEPRDFAAGIAIGSRYYVLGGLGTQLEAGLLQAPVSANGTLGEFGVYPRSLTRASMGHTCHLIGKNLYVIGGQDDTLNAYARVEKAALP